jgi:hypothetical protein
MEIRPLQKAYEVKSPLCLEKGHPSYILQGYLRPARAWGGLKEFIVILTGDRKPR